MFKKLRLKLTLINISVVGVVLLLFFTGIYILMKQDLSRRSDQTLRFAAAEGRVRLPRRTPQDNGRLANSFYITEDPSGKVLSQSQNPPVTKDDLRRLFQKAYGQGMEKGLVEMDSVTYRYLRTSPPGNTEYTIAFLNIQQERETLGRLKAILFFTGLAGLLVVFICSLFLADRALIPIKRSWERQKNFAADASHELRSPLAAIQTNLELVMGNPEETIESQRKWLENIQAENRRMTKLVTDLLMLARADSDQKLVEKTLFPLSSVIKEVTEAYTPVAAGKHLELLAVLDENVYFFGDAERIRQLVIILVDNAIKYTPEGGSVSLGLKSSDEHVEISVADTGEGIPREHIGRIFERFYRIDKARSRESGGTGLGLSIADWIVREHRGTISVSSTPGKGSTFKVSLPRMRPLPHDAAS